MSLVSVYKAYVINNDEVIHQKNPQITRYVNYHKKVVIKILSTYIKIINPTENLKKKIEKIIELELLENKINRINRIKKKNKKKKQKTKNKKNKRNNNKRIKGTRRINKIKELEEIGIEWKQK